MAQFKTQKFTFFCSENRNFFEKKALRGLKNTKGIIFFLLAFAALLALAACNKSTAQSLFKQKTPWTKKRYTAFAGMLPALA